jgi:hypothetical protein
MFLGTKVFKHLQSPKLNGAPEETMLPIAHNPMTLSPLAVV